MRTTSKQKTSANEDQPKPTQTLVDVPMVLEQADKALLAGKYVVAHSCMRLAITELSSTSKNGVET